MHACTKTHQIHTFMLMEGMNKRGWRLESTGEAEEEEEKETKKGMMKEGESCKEEDREKLEESESVCECNSLPLSNPREFTDCRGKERGREA